MGIQILSIETEEGTLCFHYLSYPAHVFEKKLLLTNNMYIDVLKHHICNVKFSSTLSLYLR